MRLIMELTIPSETITIPGTKWDSFDSMVNTGIYPRSEKKHFVPVTRRFFLKLRKSPMSRAGAKRGALSALPSSPRHINQPVLAWQTLSPLFGFLPVEGTGCLSVWDPSRSPVWREG